MKGSLLIQFKYTENEGNWTHTSSSNVYLTINSKSIDITPYYPTSIMETSASFTIGDSSSTSNTSQTYSVALYANGQEEYSQHEFSGFTPYGNNYSHTGGRNDRLAPTRRTGHVTNVRKSIGYTHAYIPRTTNKITFETKVKCSADTDFMIKDFFMIVKEIGIPVDQVKSGSVTYDGV